MAKRKRIEEICRKFQNNMQKLVDKSDDITGVSMTVGDKTVTIAEKGKEELNDEHDTSIHTGS